MNRKPTLADTPLFKGFDSIEHTCPPTFQTPDDALPSCWVRSSAKQFHDDSGQVIGFRHQLVLRGKIIKTGTGADGRRRFETQVEFTNRILAGSQTVNQHGTTARQQISEKTVLRWDVLGKQTTTT